MEKLHEALESLDFDAKLLLVFFYGYKWQYFTAFCSSDSVLIF
jgi:hypothetical protein